MPRKRTILTAVAATLAVALLLPFLVNVNRFRSQIVVALEAGLGRPVQVGDVRLKLLSGPGFDLENVSVAATAVKMVRLCGKDDSSRLHFNPASILLRLPEIF